MIDATICKFKCTAVTQLENKQEVAKLMAVSDEKLDPERRFSKYTPAGTFEASITNESVHGFFVPGEVYLLTISKEPKAE